MYKHLPGVLACVMAIGVSTAAHAAPSVATLSPTTLATDVRVDEVLVATFDDTINVVTGGVVVVSNLTQGTGMAIALPDAAQVSVSGSDFLITPLAGLEYETAYAVLIGTNALADTNGVAFAGITNATTWQFTTRPDLNPGLVAYWPLNDGTNWQGVTGADDVIDDPSHGAADATSSGSASGAAHWYFDATRDRIVLRTPDFHRLRGGTMDITGDFTWSIWMRTLGNDSSIFMGTRSGTYLRFRPIRIDGSYLGTIDFSPDANDDTWHHMVLRRTNDVFSVWTDGILRLSATKVVGDNNNILELGGSSRYNEDLNGYISEAAVWDVALSSNRIQQLAAGGDVILDTPAPQIVGLAPTNNATLAEVHTDLVVTFDRNMIKGAGQIVVSNLTAATGMVFNVKDGEVSVLRNKLILNPPVDLQPSTTYAVTVASGVLQSGSGVEFPGISNTTTWGFTTFDTDVVAPRLASTAPFNWQTLVRATTNLTATFSEDVMVVSNGLFTITNLTQGTAWSLGVPDPQLSVTGRVVTISPAAPLAYGDRLAVLVGSNTVADLFGNVYAGITNETVWRFTTDPRPDVVTLSPTNGSTGEFPNVLLVATFDEPVFLEDGGAITITNLTRGTATTVTLPDSGQTSVAGGVVTLDLATDFELGHTYAVLIGSNAIEDVAGNAFLGINDSTVWRFTVTTNVAWDLVAYWPMNDGVDGQAVSETGVDDVIDDPTHPATDATVEGSGGTWFKDPERGIVFSTGDDDRLHVGTMGIVGDFTWQAWIKGTSTGTFMGTRSGSYFRFHANSISGSFVGWNFAPDANDDVWHHMVLRRQGSAWTVWIDGVQASGSDSEAGPNNSPLELGGTSRYSEDFTGLMDDVAVWRVALPDSRIQQLAAGFPLVPLAAPNALLLILR